ncbi:MAG: hypothetical protein ACM3QU_07085 [Verrucomicrobiota bacterium]
MVAGGGIENVNGEAVLRQHILDQVGNLRPAAIRRSPFVSHAWSVASQGERPDPADPRLALLVAVPPSVKIGIGLPDFADTLDLVVMEIRGELDLDQKLKLAVGAIEREVGPEQASAHARQTDLDVSADALRPVEGR